MTMILEKGAIPKDVQHMLGHKNVSRVSDKMQDNITYILDSIFE